MLRKFTLIILITFLLACSSNTEQEKCTKTIIVQNEFTITSPSGTTIIPEIKQEVACDFPEPTVAQSIQELPRLQQFSYQILSTTVVPDTGNNTSSVAYTVELRNLSNEKVTGIPYVTTRVNNQSFTTSSANTDSCLELQPNAVCVIRFSAEESHNIGVITDYAIENVEYLIYNSL